MKEKLINVVSNKNNKTRRVKKDLFEKLESRGYKISQEFDHDAELTISLGGDGSFIKTVQLNHFPKTPIVGINTGTLGFFQEIDPNKIDDFLDLYEQGKYHTEEDKLIRVKIFTKNKLFTEHVINEVVLKGKNSKIVQMQVYINEHHLQIFAGDGMMVSSPIGSTAYNMSVGGSIVYTTLESMQITPIAPIHSSAYRSLLSSLVVDGNTKITLKPTSRYTNGCIVLIDGYEKEYWNLQKVEITLSDKYVKRLVFKEDFYWQNLKDKFI